MSKTNAPLTDSRCSKASYHPDEDNRLKDSGGLFLELLENGEKRWRLSFRQENGRLSTKTLGKFPTMSVAEARQARDAQLQFSLLDDLFAENTSTTELNVANLAAKKTTRTASTTLKTPTGTKRATKTSPTAKKTKSVDTTMPSKTTKATKSTAKKATATKASVKSAASKLTKTVTVKATKAASKTPSAKKTTRTAVTKTSAKKTTTASKKVATKTSTSPSVRAALEKATLHRSVKQKSSSKKASPIAQPQKPVENQTSRNVVKTPLSQAKKIESTPTNQSEAWKWGGLTLNPNKGLINQFAHLGERPDSEANTAPSPENTTSKQHLDIVAPEQALPTPIVAQSPIIDSALTTADTNKDSAGVSLSSPAQTKPKVDLPLVPPLQPKPLLEDKPQNLPLSGTKIEQTPRAEAVQNKAAAISQPVTRNTTVSSAQPTGPQGRTTTTPPPAAPKKNIIKIAALVILTVGVTWGIQTVRINDVQSLLNATKQQVSTLTLANKKAKKELQEASAALARLQISLKEQQAQATKALTEALSGMGQLKSELSSVQKQLASEEAKRKEAEAEVEQHQVFRSSLSDLRRSYTNNRD